MIEAMLSALNKEKAAFIAALIITMAVSVSAVRSSQDPLQVGLLKGDSTSGERPLNPDLLGKERKLISRTGRENVFAFFVPKKKYVKPKWTRRPYVPLTPIKPKRVFPPPPPPENGGPALQPRVIKSKDLPFTLLGFETDGGTTVIFEDRKTPGKRFKVKPGETIPDHDYKLIETTAESLVIQSPQGERLRLYITLGSIKQGTPDGGHGRPVKKESPDKKSNADKSDKKDKK